MRSIRAVLLLAATALIAVAVAVPAVASAANWKQGGVEIAGLDWTQEGTPLSKEGSLSFSGPFNVTGMNATIKCQASGSIALSPGESGQVKSFTIAPSGCALSGLLGYVCKEVKSVTANSLPWSATAAGTGASPTVSVKGVSITYTLAGGECGSGYPVTYTGNMTATPDKGSAISTLSFSGTLKDSLGNNATPSGTVNVSPAAKYGIANHSVNVAINGTLNWTGSLGGTACQASGSLTLEAGSGGKVPSLTTSECSSVGAIAAACGSKSGLTINSLPWTLVDEGTYIAIKGVSIGIGTPSCGYGNFTGELKATPDNASSISQVSITGSLSNGGTNISFSGKWNWSPAGTYGL